MSRLGLLGVLRSAPLTSDLVRRVIRRLDTNGWRRHDSGDENGPNCVGGAFFLEAECEILPREIRDFIPTHGPVARWNDFVARDYADVRRVLIDMAEALEAQGR